MQSPLALLLLLVGSSMGPAAAAAAGGRSGMSPITRVVELLKDLGTKIDAEGKVEENLYENFVCWSQSVLSQKKAAIADATSRLGSLKTYIGDLAAGRIELTTERVDLESELEQISGDIEIATSQRSKEQDDFMQAKEEMEQAIGALQSAIQVLKTATEAHKDGVLLTMREQLSEGAAARAAEAKSLAHAADLGDKFLTKGDAVFLRRVITGDVPEWEWKKLNRKATFKKSYKARSFKIQEVLANLLTTFETSLSEATNKDETTQATFDKLMKGKGSEKLATEEALGKLEKENGAKGMSSSEAQAEVDLLEGQVEADQKYITEVSEALAKKKGEWKDRQALRAGEAEAISRAIAILYSDDNRDLFKKSFKSQGYAFLQLSQGAGARARNGAADVLRRASRSSRDRRLAALAVRVADGHFSEVLAAIDQMLDSLRGEETSDLKKKEACEADRAADTRDAILLSRAMDEFTDTITSLKAQIADLSSEISELDAQVKGIDEELKQETAMRTDENTAYLRAKKEDKDAKAVVVEATEVLKTFYAENKLVLAQREQQRQPVVDTAGAAPPPPPTTWEKPYGGKTRESMGIVSILIMIREDIQKDINKAEGEEQSAVHLYEATTTALGEEKGHLESLIQDKSLTKSSKETAVQDTVRDRGMKKQELDIVTSRISGAESGCDYFTINFPVRTTNRQLEMDGLRKAKAILSGAKFDAPDPSREIKPGDALVQRPATRHVQ